MVATTFFLSTACLGSNLSPVPPQKDSTVPPAARETSPSRPVAQAPQPGLRLPGKLVFSVAGKIEILQAGEALELSPSNAYQPAAAPDGRGVAFVSIGDSYSDLYFQPLPTGDPVRLTKNQSPLPPGSEGYVKNSVWAFSPCWLDGQRLAYLSDSGSFELALWQIDISGRRARLSLPPPGTSGLGKPACAPDGTRVAASAYQGNTTQIWILDLRTGAWKQLTDLPAGAYDPAWSPTGELIAFAGRAPDGTTDIWLTVPGNATPQRVTNLGRARAPAWAPDGQHLAFLVEDRGIFNIWVMELTRNTDGSVTVGRPQQVTRYLMIDANSGISWGP